MCDNEKGATIKTLEQCYEEIFNNLDAVREGDEESIGKATQELAGIRNEDIGDFIADFALGHMYLRMEEVIGESPVVTDRHILALMGHAMKAGIVLGAKYTRDNIAELNQLWELE